MAFITDGEFRINYDNEHKKYFCFLCNKKIKSGNAHIETIEHINIKKEFQKENKERYYMNNNENEYEEQLDLYYG